MGKRKKWRGRYCWVCEARRPSECFSRKGRARCICRRCQKLGPEELARRQVYAEMRRCVTSSGYIPLRRRADFERFLQHDDPHVRKQAEWLHQQDEQMRAVDREEEEKLEAWAAAWEERWSREEANRGPAEPPDDDRILEDIPF